MQLKVADLVRDSDLLPDVQAAAEAMLDAGTERMDTLQRRWIGEGTRFGKV